MKETNTMRGTTYRVDHGDYIEIIPLSLSTPTEELEGLGFVTQENGGIDPQFKSVQLQKEGPVLKIQANPNPREEPEANSARSNVKEQIREKVVEELVSSTNSETETEAGAVLSLDSNSSSNDAKEEVEAASTEAEGKEQDENKGQDQKWINPKHLKAGLFALGSLSLLAISFMIESSKDEGEDNAKAKNETTPLSGTTKTKKEEKFKCIRI